jgi:hypothetical protein
MSDQAVPTRKHPMPGQVLMHVENMGNDYEDVPDAEVRTPTTNLDAAMVVTSRTTWDAEFHRPVIDLDLPIEVLPSSTPGHHHLFIDAPMSWDAYLALLDALVVAGLVEAGYVKAARHRGHTAVRVPWFRKGDRAPMVDGSPRPVPTLADVWPVGA